MTLKHLKDTLEDLMIDLAQEVYDKHDEISSQASEGLLDDDVDQLMMNVSEILLEMIKEKLK